MLSLSFPQALEQLLRPHQSTKASIQEPSKGHGSDLHITGLSGKPRCFAGQPNVRCRLPENKASSKVLGSHERGRLRPSAGETRSTKENEGQRSVELLSFLRVRHFDTLRYFPPLSFHKSQGKGRTEQHVRFHFWSSTGSYNARHGT